MLMYLTSPARTTSQLLYHRAYDVLTQTRNYRSLVVTSLHFWGENPMGNTGEWTVLLKSARLWGAALRSGTV